MEKLHPLANELGTKPKADGGQLGKNDTVEVVSCMKKNGRWVFNDLRWGEYVIIEAPGDYQRDCFRQYGPRTDSTRRYVTQYKPYYLIGLKLGVSIATIMCRGEPTGQTKIWAGERLDGEGGFMVYGKLTTAESMRIEGLPIGLAHGIMLKSDVKKRPGSELGRRRVQR